MVRISTTSKLDGIRSWSLPAGSTCPGSFNADGSLVPACQGCYAKKGNYRYPNVRAPREENRRDWRKTDWVERMVWELDIDRWFRWFDSGDAYHPELALKIKSVIELTPWCTHWIPTRSYKCHRIAPTLEQINRLPNANVRYSSDSIDGKYESHHGSTIIPTHETSDPNLHVCHVHKFEGGKRKCERCRKCWDKEVNIIAYVKH